MTGENAERGEKGKSFIQFSFRFFPQRQFKIFLRGVGLGRLIGPEQLIGNQRVRFDSLSSWAEGSKQLNYPNRL